MQAFKHTEIFHGLQAHRVLHSTASLAHIIAERAAQLLAPSRQQVSRQACACKHESEMHRPPLLDGDQERCKALGQVVSQA